MRPLRPLLPLALPLLPLLGLTGCLLFDLAVGEAGAAPVAPPDIDAPLKTGHTAPGDVAVVIGNEDYGKIADVPYAHRDADAFVTFLKYTRGVPSERVRTLKDADADQMLAAVKEMAAKRPTGIFWIYYAGHGMADPNGHDRLLLGWDAAGTADNLAKKGAPVEGLQAAAAAAGAKVVMLIDACYNGGTRTDQPGQASLTGGARIAVPEQLLVPPQVLEWSASAPSQLALPLNSVQHGAFTWMAIGALRGWADGERDGRRDGIVTLEEAQMYVENRFSAIQLTSQQPRVSGEGWAQPLSGRAGATLERGPADDTMQQVAGRAPASTPASPPVPTIATVRPAPTAAPTVAPTLQTRVDLSAEQEARRKREEAVAAVANAERLKQEAALAQERALREKTESHQSAARADWSGVVAFAAGGGPEAISALEKFIQTYSRPVMVEGEQRNISVPEVEQARALLARLQTKPAPTPALTPVQSALQTAPPAGNTGKVLAMYNQQMTAISAGTFLMGSPIDEVGRDTDETVHTVTITAPFWLGTTEVTQGLWEAITGENPARMRAEHYESGESLPCSEMGVRADLPVFCVSWRDTLVFANKLSALEGLTPVYVIEPDSVTWNQKASGYRLPTEAEWEYAARAGTYGARYSGTNSDADICRYANVVTAATRTNNRWISWDVFGCTDSYTGVAPVGKFLPNAWGIHDMTGNVREWVWDMHAPFDGTAAVDPLGSGKGINLQRGGDWAAMPSMLRVAERSAIPREYDTLVGMRLARNR